ncbi:glycosyltransferase family 4 protein [Thermaerobacillus caldiproteolyticus]|uniref:glycosyltransferase family 4 protein n=1 Tax=Thermaerobacillus caldiproteolyticus TaxID=247480 RepID=UPI00188D8C71|nr:glycosyltransferase family 4 protein [Anoxybacillus caldiproteolyticus]QPA32320.1 glycosyltransferase [Anoxybacillus caldiproteolyticus]
MKILMICTEKLPVPPVLGGAIQTYISGVLPYLSKFHDITVLGISDPSLPDQETINGVHYVRVPGKVFEIYRENVVRYVEANHFDLIHIFNRPRLVIPVRNVAPKSKITLSMHNDMFNPEKIDPEEAQAALEEVSNIVTVSNYVGNVIRDLYPQASPKIRTIYSGVDTERFLPGSHPKMQKIRNEIRQAHGLENKTVILYAGRLSNNKGVDKLVRALPELSKKFKDLALVIVGSKWFSQNDVTDYVAYVRALAKKLPIPVVTTGFVAPDEIQNWFAAADLFVCTSQWQEPLARVHYEAMAAGLPIVTTARGGNPEVILSNENGLIVENPEDPNCFVEKISQILSGKSLMKRMGEKGRGLAVSRYKWDRVASELLEVWAQAKEVKQEKTNEEHIAEPVAEPVAESVAEPVAEHVIEPVTESVAEHAAEFESENDNIIEGQLEKGTEEQTQDPSTETDSTHEQTRSKVRGKHFIITSGVRKTEMGSTREKIRGKVHGKYFIITSGH